MIHPIRRRARLRINALKFCMIGSVTATALADDSWRGWGGPGGNFAVTGTMLLDELPKDGFKKIWSRDIEGGYSSIAVADGVAYVLARTGDEERVLALDARTGETKWEHKYTAKVPQPELSEEEKTNPDREPRADEYIAQFGFGPNSTALILNDRIITVGYLSQMFCLGRADGKVLWSHDLTKEYQSNFLRFGYSASPIEYRNTIITPVGGKNGHGIVAFDPQDGKVLWHNQDFEIGYSTPRVFNIQGRDVLVVLGVNVIAMLNPANGEMWWKTDLKNDFGNYIPTPMLIGENRVFVGNGRNGPNKEKLGSPLFKLGWKDDKLEVTDEWSTPLQLNHFNAVVVDSQILTTLVRPEVLASYGIADGQELWKDRAVGPSNLLVADDKIIALSQDGMLRILRLKSGGVDILAQEQVLGERSWAPPTLIENTLFIRDRQKVTAIELQRPATMAK